MVDAFRVPRLARDWPLRLAVLAVALLAPARPAEAQLCAPGTLATYDAPGFACTLGGIRFGDFYYGRDAEAIGAATATITAPGDVAVVPFTGTDRAGRVTLGFEFTGLVGQVVLTDTSSDQSGGFAAPILGIGGAAVEPRRRLLATSHFFELSAPGVVSGGARPAYAFVFVEGAVGTGFSHDCFLEDLSLTETGVRAGAISGRCAPPWPDRFYATWDGIAFAQRDLVSDEKVTVTAASVTLTRVMFTLVGAPELVPEPATCALVGLGVGGLACIRRYRHG